AVRARLHRPPRPARPRQPRRKEVAARATDPVQLLYPEVPRPREGPPVTPSLPLVVAVFAAPAANLPTELWQVAPDTRSKPGSDVRPTKDRAVLLIPGLKIHPLRPALAA